MRYLYVNTMMRCPFLNYTCTKLVTEPIFEINRPQIKFWPYKLINIGAEIAYLSCGGLSFTETIFSPQ